MRGHHEDHRRGLLTTTTDGVVTRHRPDIIRRWIDAPRRDAVHSAITLGVDYALAKAALTIPAISVIDRTSGYLWRSVPRAIRYFFGRQAEAA